MCCSWACVPACAAGDMPNEVDAPHICAAVSFIISHAIKPVCRVLQLLGYQCPQRATAGKKPRSDDRSCFWYLPAVLPFQPAPSAGKLTMFKPQILAQEEPA